VYQDWVCFVGTQVKKQANGKLTVVMTAKDGSSVYICVCTCVCHQVCVCFLGTQVKKQANGKLTVVMTAKDGSSVEITDNDQVLMATGRRELCTCLCVCMYVSPLNATRTCKREVWRILNLAG
jgi:nitrate reductase NapAB chaperone NapD